jgi:RNA polymerase sigma-70 factor (ECF subfamily)
MSARAFGLAYRVLGDSGLAEDVVHDAFLSLWEQVDRLDAGRGAIEGLVLTIVHRRAVDAVRARRRRADRAEPVAAGFDPVDEDAADLFAAAVQALSREAIDEALGALAGDQRETIELAYFGGLTMTEIAARMDAPLGTVKSRVRLGLVRLREMIGSEWSNR